MQLIDTVVRQANDGASGLTVEFVGEGGEAVSVRFQGEPDGLDRSKAISRAKAMMVQLTSFADDEIRPAAVVSM